MRSPDFDNLKALIAVAESKNFNEAAAKLGISQPYVSLKMKQLEEASPLPLFQIEGKKKVLTHYGRSLYEVVKKQNSLLEESVENLNRHYADGAHLTLRVGGRTEILEYLAPLLEFEGRIELIDLASQESVQKLLNHEIDVAISYTQPDSTEFIAKKIFKSCSHFVAHTSLLKRPLNLELARNREFLTNTPCIIYQCEGHMLSDWIAHYDLTIDDLKVRYVAEDWRTVQNLVDQGLGYALVPEYVKSYSHDMKRLELPAQQMPRFFYYAIYDKGLKKIEPFKRVLEFNKFKTID